MQITVELRDILDISGKVPKLPGYTQDGKFYLEVPEELKNRTLIPNEGLIINESEAWKANPGAYDVELLLDDLKQKYQYGVARKTDINERLSDKEQTMREIAAIAQNWDISGDELDDFMKTMKGLTDKYTDTYDTYGNSDLLNINDDTRRYSYYSSLFVTDIDKANTRAISGGGASGWLAHNAELSLQRYEELRAEIQKTFGDDKELLEKNLNSLDKAFEFNLQRVATSDSRRVWIDQVMDRAAKSKGEEPPYELNKLALHRDFNFDKFEANAKNLMKQFAQEFIGQIKSGVSYASAKANAVDIMTRSTKTTSINELSFSDFMIFDGLPVSNATTKAENLAALSNRNFLFNNNPNLSEELRELLK